jgi:hypothetical protein
MYIDLYIAYIDLYSTCMLPYILHIYITTYLAYINIVCISTLHIAKFIRVLTLNHLFIYLFVYFFENKTD